MLLRHSAKLEEDANMIDAAITHVLENGFRTPDLYSAKTRKYNSTWEVGAAVEQQFSDTAMRRYSFHAV
jgi:3-isopropylmalate dehydrogenase